MAASSPLSSGPIIWSDVPASPVTDAITARTVVGSHLSSTTFELESHAPIPRHAHPNDELGIVLRGGLRMSCGADEFVVKAGEAFFVSAGTPHEGAALAGGCTLLECYSPPRVPAPADEETR